MTSWDEHTPAERGRACLTMAVVFVLLIGTIKVSGDIMNRDQWPIPLRLGISFAISALPTFLTPPGARHVTASIFYAFWLGNAMLRFGPLLGLNGWRQDVIGLLLLTPCFFLLWHMRSGKRDHGMGGTG